MKTQEELVSVFKILKDVLKRYEDPLKPKVDLDSRYDLWSFRDLEVEGRKRTEISFASLIIQSSYVGFYFMPVYSDNELKQFFDPELLKLLKGKSCFHIKRLTPSLKLHIEEALEKGFALYKSKGWI